MNLKLHNLTYTTRRIDHALSKSRGEIRIDEATYEIARAFFRRGRATSQLIP